jgi:uncharacterized protein (DUF1499 family)
MLYKIALLLIVGLPLVLLGAGQYGLLKGQAPHDLGVTDGRLKAPSVTRNSVSSQATLYPDHPQRVYAQIEPLPLKAGGALASISTLTRVLNTLPGVTLVEQRPDYLRAAAQTRWLKFVDDLEFWVEPARSVIEIRSSSRLGREDFGANRARVEAIRSAYMAEP